MTSAGLRAVLSLFLTCVASLLYAAPQVVSVHLLPPEFYVGDTVELRIILRSDEADTIRPPAVLPAVDWVFFHGARVEQRGGNHELRIFFSSFSPGTRTLPELDFGSYVLSGMKIHTSSILENEGELEDIRGQLYLPGTFTLLIITVLVVLIGPLALIAVSGILRERLRSAAVLLARKRPYWRLRRDLKELSSQALMMPDRDFYYRLSDSVRSYISRRTGWDCITTTIHEIRSMMQSLFPKGDIAMRLIHFLEYADMIKFAGVEAGSARKGDDILRLGELASAVEEECRLRDRDKQEDADVDI
ncbi:hypothetical protein B4O97_02500 [Marispirochaeta aestuarii]|uniref:DUF4129 domain-containing protein n=1 Tax=Marispirochaeta aestuarii TaxID=1963862 RepID=A0A1Y1S2F1_9SPIO|nr:hypothetical protein [Marispirochaeta aestuarii]ORC37889.1 hypothetical protein B4O97_02500 [Marispirochaeta aestuarii]